MTLSSPDIRAVTELLADTAALRDVVERRGLLVNRACDMLRAKAVILLHRRAADEFTLNVLGYHGWQTPAQDHVFIRDAHEHRYRNNPMLVAFDTHIDGQPLNLTRRAALADAEWYSHPYVSETFRTLEIDDLMLSAVPYRGGWLAVAAVRAWGDPTPFSEHDAAVGALLCGAMAQWPIDEIVTKPELSPRLCQIFTLLLDGASEKQTAQHLGISEHTAHRHIRRLYEKLGVSSRGELFAYARQHEMR